MIETKGKIKDLVVTLDRKVLVTFEFENNASEIEELKDKELSIELKQYRPKRSIDANSYFWVLCDKLSLKLKMPPKEIYRQYIKDVSGNSYISPVRLKDKDKAIAFWESHGIGWVCDDTGSSKIDGCTNLIYYAGSSTYDTEQMSRLIELIVFDCKENNIETKTPEEIANLLSLWGEER